MGSNSRSKYLLSDAALPTECRLPRAATHHMPNFRMPTCVEGSARRKLRAQTNHNNASFRDPTLSWFRRGDALADATGTYELDSPETSSRRTTRILIAVSTAAGLLVTLAYLVS